MTTAHRPEDSENADERYEGVKRLLRDVGVNLVANLLAAAIIYLLGAFVGLLPRSPYLIVTALTLIGLSAGLVLPVVVLAVRNPRRKLDFAAVTFICTGAGIALAPLTGNGFEGDPVEIGQIVFGLVCVVFGGAWLVVLRRVTRP
jgi:hypothetical protein